ncbi:MAG: hypothetical protein WC314_24570 [Vulcanimicrobiota bacterium]
MHSNNSSNFRRSWLCSSSSWGLSLSRARWGAARGSCRPGEAVAPLRAEALPLEEPLHQQAVALVALRRVEALPPEVEEALEVILLGPLPRDL